MEGFLGPGSRMGGRGQQVSPSESTSLWLRGLRVAGTEAEEQGERLRPSAVGEPPLPTAQARALGSPSSVPLQPLREDLVLRQKADG